MLHWLPQHVQHDPIHHKPLAVDFPEREGFSPAKGTAPAGVFRGEGNPRELTVGAERDGLFFGRFEPVEMTKTKTVVFVKSSTGTRRTRNPFP